MPRPVPRARSFLWITFAYAAALAVSVVVARAVDPGLHPLWVVAAADAAATVVVFAFSVALDNSSVYDPYWSVGPMVIAPALALRPEAAATPLARKVAVCLLVAFWGARLTWNWARGFRGLGHEDWRYADIRRKTGRAYWPVSFLGIHFMPTVLVYLGCLSLWPAFTGARPLGALDAAAVAVTLAAALIEAIADEQLLRFRRTSPAAGAIMSDGLWSYSRHPNYFGEVLFWWGLFLFGLAGDAAAFWTALGPVSITALFLFISIPMIDRRSAERRPAYAVHMKRVSALVPWFPRRGSG